MGKSAPKTEPVSWGLAINEWQPKNWEKLLHKIQSKTSLIKGGALGNRLLQIAASQKRMGLSKFLLFGLQIILTFPLYLYLFTMRNIKQTIASGFHCKSFWSKKVLKIWHYLARFNQFLRLEKLVDLLLWAFPQHFWHNLMISAWMAKIFTILV